MTAILQAEPRYWKDFKTLQEFKAQSIQGCDCRRKCSVCLLPWDETRTTHVHMKVAKEVSYLCDNCLPSSKPNSNET